MWMILQQCKEGENEVEECHDRNVLPRPWVCGRYRHARGRLIFSHDPDALGRNVWTDAGRIVIVPIITETVYAVGIGDKLVGVTTYCNYPDDVNSRKENGTLSNIGGYSTPNVEAILNLTPDLVLVDGSVSAHQTLIDSLTVMNVTVVAIYKGSSIGEVYKNIEMVGKISGASDNSTALINEMKSRISNIESKLSSVTTQRSIVDAIWLDPIYVAAGNTYVQDMFNISKGNNPFADQTGFPVVSMEAVIEANPDVLVLPGKMGMDYSDDLISYLRNDSMWSQNIGRSRQTMFSYSKIKQQISLTGRGRGGRCHELLAA